MFNEYKTYQWICDSCGTKELTQGVSFERPANWAHGPVNNPYSIFEKTTDICADCVKYGEVKNDR